MAAVAQFVSPRMRKTRAALRTCSPITIKSILAFLFFFIPLIIVVPLLTVNHFKSEIKAGRGSNLNLISGPNTRSLTNNDALILFIFNSGLDTTGDTVKLNIMSYPLNGLNDGGNGWNDDLVVDSQFTRPINITFAGSNVIQQKAFTPIIQQDLVFPFDSGDVTLYPWDAYQYQMIAEATSLNRNGSTTSYPVYISTQLFFPLFNSYVTPLEDDTFTGRDILIKFERTTSTKVFSVFIMVLMWTLSSGMLTLAVGIWLRGRTVEPPTIAASLALLFAIPNMRNAQPSISSSSGCVSDFLSFYWAMMLASIAAAILLLNYIVKYKAAPKSSTISNGGKPNKVSPSSSRAGELNKSATAVAVDQV